jgi:nucleotidyltransferase/DNA polymerase involved in DNA repair
VEQEDASLCGRPFAVQRGGRVVAVSDSARECGVACGWSVGRARSLAPQVLLVPHDAALVARAQRQVLAELYACTPRIEVRGGMHGGLIAFEFPHSQSNRRLLAALVACWQAHCGTARDRITAHLAALTVEQGHTRRVAPGRENVFLARVDVQVLAHAGVSPRTIERLKWFGLRHVSDLQPLPARQLQAQFKDGALLARFQRSHSSAEVAVKTFTPDAGIHTRHVFEQAATEPGECLLALDEAVKEAPALLNGRGANSLALCLETSAGKRTASRLLREPMFSPRSLYDIARALLRELFETGVGEVQVLEVRLDNLESRTEQGELWATRARRHLGLAQVLGRLEARQAHAVLRLRARDVHAPLLEERFELVPALELASPRGAPHPARAR